ncbi:hypothetical protein AB0O31_04430 [Kitasatospora cineracea]|uniref:hypothetical protein n=1 Tax=Kitasatospora cineracea TaxID=88074 RepID=UPI00343B5838
MKDEPEPECESAGTCAECRHQQVGSGLAVGGNVGEVHVHIGLFRMPPALGALVLAGLGQAATRLARATRATADFFERHTPQPDRPSDGPAAKGTDP